jgi:hypothetical protein
MRGLLAAAGLVFTALFVCIGMARWLGQQVGEPPFPLPDDQGCWDGLCITSLSPAELARQLTDHPGIRSNSVECNSPQPAGACSAFRFSMTAGTDILLQRDTHHYNLVLGRTGDPSPLRVGDVIAALGPPGEIVIWTGVVILRYRQQELQVTVRPTLLYKPQGVYLVPTDAVLNLEVVRDGMPNSIQLVSGVLVDSWHGFGIYRLYG